MKWLGLGKDHALVKIMTLLRLKKHCGLVLNDYFVKFSGTLLSWLQ